MGFGLFVIRLDFDRPRYSISNLKLANPKNKGVKFIN